MDNGRCSYVLIGTDSPPPLATTPANMTQYLNTDHLNNDKQNCRNAIKPIREIANRNNPQAPQQIIRQFLKSPFAKQEPAKIIAGYLPIASEINIIPLLTELRDIGAKILMPAIIAENTPLQFREWTEETPLVKEKFGTKAPHPDSPTQLPDIICAPLLAFDEHAYRLGYGGGFYDRSIAETRKYKPCIAIGFAFNEQKIHKVPTNKYDIQLNAIITPTALYVGAPIGTPENHEAKL